MKSFFKAFGFTALLAGLLISGGCGGYSATVSQSTDTAPSVVFNAGAATTTAQISANSATGLTALTIPAGIVITTPGGFSAAPAITVTVPTGNPNSLVGSYTLGGTTYRVNDAAGAVDISFGTSGNVTLSGAGATVKIPVSAAPANPIVVTSVKPNGVAGTIYSSANNATSVNQVTYASGVVTVTRVTDFCAFLVNAQASSGSTGSSGGSN